MEIINSDEDLDMYFNALPRDTRCEVIKHVNIPISFLVTTQQKWLANCVKHLEPYQGAEEISYVPYTFIRKFPNITTLSLKYPIKLTHYDDLIDLAKNTGLVKAKVLIDDFKKELLPNYSIDEDLLRGKYLTDDDIANFKKRPSHFRASATNQDLYKLISDFINLRQENADRKDSYYFDLGSIILTQDSIEVEDLKRVENLLSLIQDKSLLEHYSGPISKAIMMQLLNFKNLQTVYITNDITLLNLDISPLIELGITSFTFDLSTIDEERKKFLRKFFTNNLTDATLPSLQGRSFPRVTDMQLPISTNGELESFQRIFPNSESIFFCMYRGKITDDIYTKYQSVNIIA